MKRHRHLTTLIGDWEIKQTVVNGWFWPGELAKRRPQPIKRRPKLPKYLKLPKPAAPNRLPF